MSPLFAVILFRFFSFTFLIHQYMLSFLNFVFLLPPFYFATVFRSFISPLYFAFLFRQSFFPFYFILPSIFALLIYFAILFALCCISPSFFALLIYFAILFCPSIIFCHSFCFSILFRHSFCPSILSFHLYFQMQTRFRISISGLHSNISSHTGMNTPQQHYILFTTHENLNPSNTSYFSRIIRLTTTHETWNPILHATHTTHETGNPIRLTTHDPCFNFARQFCLAFFSPFYFVSYLNCQIYTRFHLSISFVSKFFFIYKPFCFSLF